MLFYVTFPSHYEFGQGSKYVSLIPIGQVSKVHHAFIKVVGMRAVKPICKFLEFLGLASNKRWPAQKM